MMNKATVVNFIGAVGVVVAFWLGIEWGGGIVKSHPYVGGKLLSANQYSCRMGVLYSRGDSLTAMIDLDGNPIACESREMTNRQYRDARND